MSVNELLRIYEDTVSYMPSSTATDQANDISLYMHSKITAAVAHSMVHYFEEQGIADYKEYCYQNSKKFRNMPALDSYLEIFLVSRILFIRFRLKVH